MVLLIQSGWNRKEIGGILRVVVYGDGECGVGLQW